MNLKRLLPCLAAIFLASPLAFGETIAKWSFETSQPGVNTLPAAPGAGAWLTNIVAEVPTGTAAGWHSANSTNSSPAGNGSSHSFSANNWSVGDFFQFVVRTVGFQNVSVSFDMARSSTGPGSFAIQYSTDGSTFTQYGSTFNVMTNGTGAPAWNGTTPSSAYSFSFDLSSVTALSNAPVVYIRLVDATAPTGIGGTCRVDNFLVSASTIPGFPTILTQPQTNTVYWGDVVYFDVTATGTSPLSYQWYYPDMNHPLSDGSSGYGVGIITNTTTSSLLLTYVNTNQAGNYQVVITNSLGAVTSLVGRLTVNVRTPIVTNIAYLRSLMDHTNWLPIDTTNIYSVTGVVTTPFNLSGTGNSTEFFMQDNTAGICVYMGGDSGASLHSAGSLVRVIGPLGQFNGLFQFNLSASNPSHSISAPISTGNPLPAPKVFDIPNIFNAAYMETNFEGSLVVVSNVFLNQSSLQFAPGAINITNVNRKYISLYVNVNADEVIGQNVPQFAASIAGVMSQYTTSIPASSGYELDILHYSDLVAGTPPDLPMPLQIRQSGTNVVLTWWAIASFTLQAAPSVTGTFTNIDGAINPVTNSVADSPARFYRLKKN